MSDVIKKDNSEFGILQPDKIKNMLEAMQDNQVIADTNLLDRIKLPSAEGTAFSIPSMEGNQDCNSFKAVILGFNDHRIYFKNSYHETGGGAPDCSSEDMKTGRGDPGGDCEKCAFNQWESAVVGKGKACSERRLFMLLLPDRMIPVKLDIPPTSLNNIKKYFMRLASEGHAFHKVVTEFALHQEKGEVTRVVPVFNSHLSESEKKGVVSYTKTLNK